MKVGADVLPWWPAQGVYLLVERGEAPATDLAEVPGVAGAWWATTVASTPLFSTAGAGPADHLLLPRRRSRRHRQAARARPRAAVVLGRGRTPRSPPRSTRSCRTRGIDTSPESVLLNSEGSRDAHRVDDRLRQGARARSERLPGLVADVQAADRAGFTSMWIPQIPGYLDAMTAIAIIGQVTERIEIGTAVVPIQTRHPDPDGAAGAHHPGGVRRSVRARPRAVAPLDRRGSARPPVRTSGPPRAELPRGAEPRVRRAGPGRRRERRVPGAQPDGRGRCHRDADPHLRARARDAAHRR